MKKTILIMAAMMAIPALAVAQKLGHINSQELIQAMPERAAAVAKLDTVANALESELTKMTDEYYSKVQDYQKNEASMTDAIKQTRQSELAEMEQRIQTFRQQAQQDLQKQQETLFAPIFEKAQKAISEVGKEEGFSYIFDTASQAIVFSADNTEDVLPKVKKKLNIK